MAETKKDTRKMSAKRDAQRSSADARSLLAAYGYGGKKSGDKKTTKK